MKNNIDLINKYCINHSTEESAALQVIREYTYKHEEIPAMITGPLVANFLKNIIHLIGAKNILELGMFTGYSTTAMAEALPKGGTIHTCELMEKHINTSQIFFNRFQNSSKIIIHKGEAINSIDNFAINSFDFIFIDADKINYINYYKKAMTLIKSRGVIILDNMLWGEEVLNPQTLEAEVLNDLNKIIKDDQRNYTLLLPIRDGLMMCIKK